MDNKTDREMMRKALKALEVLTDTYDDNAVGIEIDAIIALRARLAQPEKELKIKTTDPFESSRVADYNRGWNDCLFASSIEKIESLIAERDALRERLARPDPLQRLTDVQQEIEAALVQPEQEPVAWTYSEGLAALKAGKCWTAYGTKQDKDNSIPLYTAPQQREWQRLTDDEIDAIDKSIPDGTDLEAAKRVFARAIEAKLKEKNT